MIRKNEEILNDELNNIIGSCFGRYAKYIIQDRALPDIRDGLKPVQRRILYSMFELGLTHDKPYKKSARTVGEVIGKYHPHGDSSIYEAMVRMSQDWKNNLPLLDMHGNNGSIDGDSAAAMRYTECRLSKVADLMLNDIKSETINFALNFDDSEKEPTILPAMIPNLLINGAMGIAAGYATNIPPFNPSEVFKAAIKIIDQPDIGLDEIKKIIPAPDFPTGGVIEGQEGIHEFFATGRGKFLISARITFDYDDKKVNKIIINEIPYETNKSQIIKQLSEILYDEKVSGLLEIRDESDKNGVCIVIEVKKDKNLDIIKSYLFKNTNLQVNYAANFVAIVDRKPMLLSLIDAINLYINHALDIQKKVAIFNLKKYEKRFEIVNGLMIAIKNIDKVITIIRNSESKESSKQNLINEFNFTDNQAEAIVNLRLYRLSKTNINDLLNESLELQKMIGELKLLISSEQLQKIALKQKIMSYIDEYPLKRRSSLLEKTNLVEFNENDIKEAQEVYIFLSRDGYLKIVNKKTYEANFISEIGHNHNDFIFYSKKCLSNKSILIVSSSGKTLVLPLYKIKLSKWKDIGDHINLYMNISSNEKIVFADVLTTINEDDQMLIFTKLGYTKKITLEEAFNFKQVKQSTCMKLKPNDLISACHIIAKNYNYFISVLSSTAKGFVFSSAEIPLLQKNASGVRALKLKENETFIAATVSRTVDLNYCCVVSSGLKFIKLADFSITSRGAVGKQMFSLKASEKVIYATIYDNNSFINILMDGNIYNCLPIYKFNNKDLNGKKIIDAYFNYSNSHTIFEDIQNAKVFPKSTHDVEEDVEQLSL